MKKNIEEKEHDCNETCDHLPWYSYALIISGVTIFFLGLVFSVTFGGDWTVMSPSAFGKPLCESQNLTYKDFSMDDRVLHIHCMKNKPENSVYDGVVTFVDDKGGN